MESILNAITYGEIKNVRTKLIISNREDAQGLKIAQRLGIDCEVIPPKGLKGWEYDKIIASVLSNYQITSKCGLICLAGYMRILSSDFVKIFANRIMNIHPSLLPSFPGLKPQKQALDYGVKVSGCTVHFVEEGIDTGPVILQRHVYIDEYDDEESLTRKILAEEHKVYPQAIKLFEEGKLMIQGRKIKIREY